MRIGNVAKAACCFLLVLAGGLPGQCVTGTNTALQFDGNDWVRVSAPGPVLSALADFTLEAWFRTTQNSFAGILCSRDSNVGGGGFELRMSSTNGIDLLYSGAPPIITGSQLADGVWHHVAATRTGATISMYIDGALTGTFTDGTAIGAAAIDSAIGCRITGVTPHSQFLGFLDEVRVWNVGRSQTQINSTRFSVLNGNEPGLVGYWRLNEGGGQVAANSASATAGTLNGTLGFTGAAGIDDPTWSFGSTAPITQCAPGTGQANSPSASLRVNGVGYDAVNGPFTVSIPTSGPAANTLTLTWQGPANAPLLLLTSAPQTNSAVFPCIGSLDLSIAGFTIVGDFFTSPFPLNYFFILNAAGFQQTSFTVPTSVLGSPWLTIQGAVANPGCSIAPYTLTATFTIQ